MQWLRLVLAPHMLAEKGVQVVSRHASTPFRVTIEPAFSSTGLLLFIPLMARRCRTGEPLDVMGSLHVLLQSHLSDLHVALPVVLDSEYAMAYHNVGCSPPDDAVTQMVH